MSGLVTDHRFVGLRQWGLNAAPAHVCQKPGCGARKDMHWTPPPADDPYWTESVHDSKEYDSPHTAIYNILTRNANIPSDNQFNEGQLAEMIAGHVWAHGYKIVRDSSRPEMHVP